MKTFMKKKRRHLERAGEERWVRLDPESSERLERLKSRIKGQSEEELIALALKYLERRTERLYKREMLKRIGAQKVKHLKKEKMSRTNGA
jgi:hypothetical protein